jgi:hypothetical protein
MGIRLRLGPFSISSRGRVGVRVGPVAAYGGGRGRRRAKARQAVYAVPEATRQPAREPTLTELHAMPSFDRRMLEGQRTDLGLPPRDDLFGMTSDDMGMVLWARLEVAHAHGRDATDQSYIQALKRMGAHDRGMLELKRADLGLPRVDDLEGLPTQGREWILSFRGEIDPAFERRSELPEVEATEGGADLALPANPSAARLRGLAPGVMAEITPLGLADSVDRPHASYDRAESRVVEVRLEVNNVGSAELQQVISVCTLLTDDMDQQHKFAEPAGSDTELDLVTLAPGKRRVETVSFLLEQNLKPAGLQIALDAGYGSDTAVWELVEEGSFRVAR